MRGKFLERAAEWEGALHLVDHILEGKSVVEQHCCRERGGIHDVHKVRPVDARFFECREAQVEVEHAFAQLRLQGGENVAFGAAQVVGEGPQGRPPSVDASIELCLREGIHMAGESCDDSICSNEATRNRWGKSSPVGPGVGAPSDTASSFVGKDGSEVAKESPDFANVYNCFGCHSVVVGERDGDPVRSRPGVDRQLKTDGDDLAVLTAYSKTGEGVEDFECPDRGLVVSREAVEGVAVDVKESGAVVGGNLFTDGDVSNGSKEIRRHGHFRNRRGRRGRRKIGRDRWELHVCSNDGCDDVDNDDGVAEGVRLIGT